MIIGIPVKEKGADPQIDERFGRCNYFCIIDDKEQITFIENSAKDQASGAGGQSVKLLADEDVDTIISPHIGPKAMDAIKLLNINVFSLGDSTTVTQALNNIKAGKLELVDAEKKGLRRV